jgi:hypothetical protein
MQRAFVFSSENGKREKKTVFFFVSSYQAKTVEDSYNCNILYLTMSKCGKDREQKKSRTEKERHQLLDKFGFIRFAILISTFLISEIHFSTTNFI